jgi:hypothetical protein
MVKQVKMVLFQQNNPKLRETKNIPPVHGVLWTLASFPAKQGMLHYNLIL